MTASEHNTRLAQMTWAAMDCYGHRNVKGVQIKDTGEAIVFFDDFNITTSQERLIIDQQAIANGEHQIGFRYDAIIK